MSLKNDDTLPLPGFSQDLSVDATVDEDFIPTSQPQNFGTSKTCETETNFNIAEDSPHIIPDSRIEDTLPSEAVTDQSVFEKDKSADFIPDTETKNAKIGYQTQEKLCKKKLSTEVPAEDEIARGLSHSMWDSGISKIPESPRPDESVTEIIVNDSSDTVDLESTPLMGKKTESERTVEKFEISGGSSLEIDRCEETQVFDNSSVLVLDQPKQERRSRVKSEEFYMRETIEDVKTNSGNPCSQNFPVKCNGSETNGEFLEEKDSKLSTNEINAREIRSDSNSSEPNSSSIVVKKVELKLSVSCLVTFNTKTNKIIQKVISKVQETPKPKPKFVYNERTSDNTSEKSKRFSASSSSSVYSDKTGLPFALPKRVSVLSDLTDSSEEEFGLRAKQERRAIERVPWSNEYLLALTMDDIMNSSIESQEFSLRPNSPVKGKRKRENNLNNLSEITEKSSTLEPKSLSNSTTKEAEEDEEEEEEQEEPKEQEEQKETEEAIKNMKEKREKEEKTPEKVNTSLEENNVAESENHQVTALTEEPTKEEDVKLCDGLPIFARWADKFYYSGILCGSGKNDRWDVKFDDGTSKTMREEFLVPAAWLKEGDLVFVLINDSYVSGQVTEIKKGESLSYGVELDEEKKKVTVEISELRLTDVMAAIIKEKYKPLVGTPRTTSNIDFDNVLSGKRLREQRTPSSSLANTRNRTTSGAKKSKSNKERPGSLKAENGHLIEDKVISTESPSGPEAGETPLRKPKDSRAKTKPRSLSYEPEGTRGRKSKSKSWLAPDGTPIPGPSGVKTKKRKTKELEMETSSESIVTRSGKKNNKVAETAKNKKKRKLEESSDGKQLKKTAKDKAKTKRLK